MTTTTWKDVREAANRRVRRRRWLRKCTPLGAAVGCILIGLALGYLYGRAF